MSATTYDPWSRDDEAEADPLRAAREEHERWSREQSLKGNDALHRSPHGVWLPREVET